LSIVDCWWWAFLIKSLTQATSGLNGYKNIINIIVLENMKYFINPHYLFLRLAVANFRLTANVISASEYVSFIEKILILKF
jgi:hypothetical protein